MLSAKFAIKTILNDRHTAQPFLPANPAQFPSPFRDIRNRQTPSQLKGLIILKELSTWLVQHSRCGNSDTFSGLQKKSFHFHLLFLEKKRAVCKSTGDFEKGGTDGSRRGPGSNFQQHSSGHEGRKAPERTTTGYPSDSCATRAPIRLRSCHPLFRNGKGNCGKCPYGGATAPRSAIPEVRR
jgi:hypothetical protein